MDRNLQLLAVPYHQHIEKECYDACRELEKAGVKSVYKGGCSAIDVARNELASEALHKGYESMLFIDSDVSFETADALRLFDSPEPVISGVYAKKGVHEMASIFPLTTEKVWFGPDAPGLYPLQYAAAGFLRIKMSALQQIIDKLKLPLCNTNWDKGIWPFFMPMIIEMGDGLLHYLAEDLAFSHRCRQAGITPMADTTMRLLHWGRYPYTWEEAGSHRDRYLNYEYKFK